MEQQLSEGEIDAYNRAYESGCALIEGHLLSARVRPKKPGWLVRRRLNKAVKAFDQALAIVPGSWPAWWLLGKVYQRLEVWTKSLECFARAHALNPEHPDVAREASIAAIDCGAGDHAVQFAQAAVAANSEDPGLVANLALAFLIAGDVPAAVAAAAKALAANPEDEISAYVRRLVQDVADGKRARPVSGAEF